MLVEDFHYLLKIKNKTELKICLEGVLHIFPAHAIVP